MLRTPLCELLRIDAPILCVPFGPWDQVELAVAVCEAGALGALKVPHSERVLPPYNRPGGPADPRALRTPLIDRLGADPESVDPATAGPELLAALREDRAHEYLPFTGQSAALIHDVRPVAEIMRELVEGAEAALARALSSRAAS